MMHYCKIFPTDALHLALNGQGIFDNLAELLSIELKRRKKYLGEILTDELLQFHSVATFLVELCTWCLRTRGVVAVNGEPSP